MKRLGIRKVATAVFNTKLVQGVDKVINFAHRAPGDVIKTVADKTGVNKLKVDVNGKNSRKKANKKINSAMKAIDRKLVEQDARDIAAAKEFEREVERDSAGLSTKVNLTETV